MIIYNQQKKGDNKMKEFKRLIAGCAIALVVWIAWLVYSFTMNSNYTMKGQIVDIQDGIYTVCDTTGNYWEFDGGDYSNYDIVEITFNDNGTAETRTDDVIINVKKF